MAITVKAADTGYFVTAILKDDGAVYNLTGCAVKLRVKHRSTGLATEVTCTVDPNPALGKVTCDLPSTLASGSYEAELRVTTGAAKTLTFPNSGYESVTIDARL